MGDRYLGISWESDRASADLSVRCLGVLGVRYFIISKATREILK
ncbi:hypothetical protein [Anabaena sp. AL09]|nr:hypothetical protein [Anabaena sp. AL09]